MGAPKRKKHLKLKIFGIIIIVLVAARIALPYVALHYANKSLENLKTMHGHIDDIDIALYRGAYKIIGIKIDKKDSISGARTPFFKTDIIDLSVEWKSLFKGRLVGELELTRPVVIFTKDKAEPKDVQKDSSDLKDIFNNFMPLDLNRFEVKEGVLKYLDKTSKPIVDIQMDNTNILAQNLSSVVDTALLPSTVVASSNIYGGTLQFNMKLNALKDQPTFDFNAELKNTQLPKLNAFFQAYANFDVNKGIFGLYTETAAKDGKFTGYVKPVIKDLDVVGKEDKKDTYWQKAWESIVGAAGVVLRNQKKEQIATKLPFSGSLKKPDTDTWYAIINLLRNAFIMALQPSIDAEININSVNKVGKKEEKKGLFKKIFKGKKKTK